MSSSFPHIKSITEEYPDYVLLKYTLKLPFAPYTGLFIEDHKDNDDSDDDMYPDDSPNHSDNRSYQDAIIFRSGEINEVIWNISSRSFECWVDNTKPYIDINSACSYELLIDQAQKQGWVVSGTLNLATE
ncbi:MAG: hypothetical protein RPR97_02775 [Colwellia sp.]